MERGDDNKVKTYHGQIKWNKSCREGR
jgi:hypothetical protein